MAKLTDQQMEQMKQMAKSPKVKVIVGALVVVILLLNVLSSTTDKKLASLQEAISGQGTEIAALQASLEEVRQLNGADEAVAALTALAEMSGRHDQAIKVLYGLYKADLERLQEMVAQLEQILGETEETAEDEAEAPADEAKE